MINNSGLICNSRGAATAVLETIAETFPRGTQRSALIAVADWIKENFPKDLDEEAKAKIARIYEELNDQAEQKALEWAAMGGTPANGTRIHVPYLFNANKKQWELEREMPPIWVPEHYLPQTETPCDEEEF